jgi:hypothetical protein
VIDDTDACGAGQQADRQPVMRRASARDAVGGSQDLFVMPSTDRNVLQLLISTI